MSDKYPQPIILSVTQSAVNTFTLSDPVRLGTDLFENKGLLIHKIEYFYNAITSELVADADGITLALAVAEITSTSKDNSSVVHTSSILGSIANLYNPVTFEFLNPLIIPQYQLYLAISTTGFAAAAPSVSAKIYVTQIDLKGNEYLELLQAMRLYK